MDYPLPVCYQSPPNFFTEVSSSGNALKEIIGAVGVRGLSKIETHMFLACPYLEM